MNSPLLRSSSRRRRQRGFTLMEMLIVLTIIALLMGMVVYHLVGFGESAKIQRVQADLLGFKEMLADYELSNGSMPTTEQGLQALWVRPTAEPIPQHWRAEIDTPQLDPWGHPYQYRNPGKNNPGRYDVFSMGPDGLPDTADDIGNWTVPTENQAPATASTQ